MIDSDTALVPVRLSLVILPSWWCRCHWLFLQLSRWPPLPPLPGCSAAYCVAVDGGPGLSDVTPGTNSQVHPQSSKWRTSHQIPGGNRSISGPYQVTPGGTRPPSSHHVPAIPDAPPLQLTFLGVFHLHQVSQMSRTIPAFVGCVYTQQP